VPVEPDRGPAKHAEHLQTPRLAAVVLDHRRVVGPPGDVVAPEVDRHPTRRALEQLVAGAMLRTVECACEDDAVRAGRRRVELREHALVEADAKVRRRNSESREALDEVRKRREDEIKGAELPRPGWFARDLSDDERPAPVQEAKRRSAEVVEV